MESWNRRSRGQKIGISAVGALVVVGGIAGCGESDEPAPAEATVTTIAAAEAPGGADTPVREPTSAPDTTTTSTAAPTTTTPSTTTTTTTTTTVPTMEPILIEGAGNDVVDIVKPEDEGMIVTIVGNEASRFFAVRNYGADGERIGSLVSTTEPYRGTRPLDWRADEWTTRLEIEAVEAWTIEVLPLSASRETTAPGTFEGTGDDVVWVVDGNLDTAVVVGNPEGRFWAVRAYGSTRESLVSTTDPFEGRVIVPRDTVLFEIEGPDAGSWSITLE